MLQIRLCYVNEFNFLIRVTKMKDNVRKINRLSHKRYLKNKIKN